MLTCDVCANSGDRIDANYRDRGHTNEKKRSASDACDKAEILPSTYSKPSDSMAMRPSLFASGICSFHMERMGWRNSERSVKRLNTN